MDGWRGLWAALAKWRRRGEAERDEGKDRERLAAALRHLPSHLRKDLGAD